MVPLFLETGKVLGRQVRRPLIGHIELKILPLPLNLLLQTEQPILYLGDDRITPALGELSQFSQPTPLL
jgi:hypothetical protein